MGKKTASLLSSDGPMSNFAATMHDIPLAVLDFDA
jgi:hypothetical protein